MIKKKNGYIRKTRDVPKFEMFKHDWSKLLNDIVRTGFPKDQIARRLNVGRDMVYSFMEGRAEPTHSQAGFLFQLHAYAVRIEHEEKLQNS